MTRPATIDQFIATLPACDECTRRATWWVDKGQTGLLFLCHTHREDSAYRLDAAPMYGPQLAKIVELER